MSLSNHIMLLYMLDILYKAQQAFQITVLPYVNFLNLIIQCYSNNLKIFATILAHI